MALTTQELEARLDAIDRAITSNLAEVTTSDGKRLRFESLDSKYSARAHVLRLLGRKPRKKALLLSLRKAR